jgi:hypothetical protein
VTVKVPAHVGIAGNEKDDYEARQNTLGYMVYNAQSVARNLFPVAKHRMLDVAQTGRFSHSIFPGSLLDHGLRNGGRRKKLITTVSRIISGHCGVRAHQKRFSIVVSIIYYGSAPIFRFKEHA